MTCQGQACSCWRTTDLPFVAANSLFEISTTHETSVQTLQTALSKQYWLAGDYSSISNFWF
jgi:hypothetical protein